MQIELKEMFEKACEIYNMIDEKVIIIEKANAKGELCNILKFELMSFLCCLSASDGRISRVEAQLIRDSLGTKIYPVNIKDFNKEYDIGNSRIGRGD